MNTDFMYFHNIKLENGDKVKIYISEDIGGGYYIGEVVFKVEWFAQDKIFYYIETKRKVQNNRICPTDQRNKLCIPAWMGLLKKLG